MISLIPNFSIVAQEKNHGCYREIVKIEGYVLNQKNHRPLQGASIYVLQVSRGTVKTEEDRFELELPK